MSGRHGDDDGDDVANQADPDWAPPPEDDVVHELGVRHTAMGATAPAETYPADLPKLEAP